MNVDIGYNCTGLNSKRKQTKRRKLNFFTMPCVVCQQKFTDALDLHKHATLSHSGLKIFFCNLCLDSFLYEKDIQQHKKDVHGLVPAKMDPVAIRRETRASSKRNFRRTSKRLETRHLKRSSRINGIQETALKKLSMKGKQRSRRNVQSRNNVEDLKAKYGCLKELTIPLTRIDNHPLLKQKRSRNQKGKSCDNNTIKNAPLNKQEVYVVKVKKKQDDRSIFTISHRKEKEKQFQDDTQKSLSIIENTILEKLVSKWRKKNMEDIPVLKSTDSLKNAVEETNSSAKVIETIDHQSPRKTAKSRKQSASSEVNSIKQTTHSNRVTSVSCQLDQVDHKISASKHNSTKTSDDSNLTPMKMLSKALERCNDHPSLKNINGKNVKNLTFFKKQNRSLVKIGETMAINDPKLLKRIVGNALPTRREATTQTVLASKDNHKVIESSQYLMSTLKPLNPTLINVKKKDALSQDQNEDKTRKSLVNRIIGICFTCREVDNLIKQLQATTKSSRSGQVFVKCPFCGQTFQSLNCAESHLKLTHLQCVVKQKKKYLPVKVIDSLETLYSTVDKKVIFDCRCCKKEFRHAEEFIQHIRNLHDEKLPAKKLEQTKSDRAVTSTSKHEDFHIIPEKESTEKVGDHTENKVTCTDSEIVINNAVDLPVREEQVNNDDRIIENINNKTSANGDVSKETIVLDNKKIKKLTIPFAMPEKPYFCLICFKSFDTSKEFLTHIGMECYLDNSSKASSNEEKGTRSKEHISVGTKRSNSTSLVSDLDKRNKIEPEATRNDDLDPAADLNSCSNTSNKQVDLDNSESMDSSITINSEQTVIIPGGACNVCGKKFDNQRSLCEHMYFLHDITLQESIIEDMLQTQCSTEEMDTMDSTVWETIEEADTQSAEAEKLWRCFQCAESFSVMESLMHHRYEEHGDESAVHVCENCSEILVSLHTVNMHLCKNVTSWSCKRCNADFLDSAALKSHNMQKHLEKIGPHICSKCNKRFLTASMLGRHASAVHKSAVNHTSNDASVPSLVQDSQRTRTSSSKISSAEENTRTNSLSEESAKVVAASHEDTSIMFNVDRAIAWKEENTNSTIKLFESDLFMCGICPAISNSKSGIKSHVKKQHKIGAEACQLCNKLYNKDSMGKHLIYHHVILPNYCNGWEPISETFHSERLLTLLDRRQLLMCCEYQKYIDMPRTETVSCARCLKQFLNGRFYRIHFLWSHDTSCLLCNEDFGTPSRAVDHKIKVHHSIGTYIWMIERVVKALLDVKVYGKTVEAIVKKLNELQDNSANNCSNDENIGLKEDNNLQDNVGPQKKNVEDMEVSEGCSSQDSGRATICEETLITAEDDNSLHKQESSEIYESEYLALANESLEQCDEGEPILIIIEDDLQKHKNDIKTFVRNICEKSSLFSEEYVTNLLTNYLNATER